MEIVEVTEENIDREHICCVINEKNGENCVGSKKAWLKERFKEGLVFKKLDVRGKVFIEYIPAEKVWSPIEAQEYMVINCLWVSGQYKGKGISSLLLEECIKDSKLKGKRGVIALAGKKKTPFLSDGNHLKHKGFKVADTAEPYFELLYLPFDERSPNPKFKESAKDGKIDYKGLKIFYSLQCPHTEKYVQIVKEVAKSRGIHLEVHRYENSEEAQNSQSPFTTYSFFYNGNFVTNEVLSEKKFIRFLEENNL